MKKSYILTIIFGIIILGITLGVYIYLNNTNKKIANQNTIITENNKILVNNEFNNEKNKIDNIIKNEILETNSNEEKISPNCLITLNKYYDKCGHTTTEYLDIQTDLLNKTEKDLQEKYQGWEIKKFSSGQITLYKEYEGECGEHYVLRNDNGKITIYKINENNQEEVFENTEIAVDYLSDTDKINIKNGIRVNGNENLNHLIEDFE